MIGRGPAVVTYHGVIPEGYQSIDADLDGSLVSPDALRRQIQLLQKSYSVISPEQFRRWCCLGEALPPRSVLITCDDGLLNTVTDMLPILQETGVSCLFFVLGDALSMKASLLWYEELYLMLLWAEQRTFVVPELGSVSTGRGKTRTLWSELVSKLSAHDAGVRRKLLNRISGEIGGDKAFHYKDEIWRRRFLLADETGLQTLVAAGMAIGAHSMSHSMLSFAGDEEVRRETQESRRVLSDTLKIPIWAFAYPFGDRASVGQREIRFAEHAHFDCAFVNCDGGFGAAFNQFAIPRVHVTNDMTIGEFEAHVSGFYRRLRRSFSRAQSLPVPANQHAGEAL
jgi:peptidoglycan/xylan/chitin deacetylase (PgdA/CDA1 family)